ncbi:unnamed protein product [Paramecium octaurelia]|uniref:Uncharacterized protein n=1 Tax=Paramecium octaurelia TaxID=43137 RepID=A0A8S1T6G1_PAROT|nr:unnamed protein product [Paramecium octaurelia]
MLIDKMKYAQFLFLYFLKLLKKDKLDQNKLRNHICYLFNEYNEQSYFGNISNCQRRLSLQLWLAILNLTFY